MLGAGVVTIIIVAVALQMGLRFARLHACPKCGSYPPMVRVPGTLRQAIWGSWNCPTCGSESDGFIRSRR
jgi:hypothetical protein